LVPVRASTSPNSHRRSNQAINDGIKDSAAEFDGVMKKVNADQVSSAAFFGARDYLEDNYLYRFVGAKIGLYGNTGVDAFYFGFFVDANHQPLDASKSSYKLHFDKGGLPPNKAFWSFTMYDGKTQSLAENPMKRYLLNSTMLKSYKYGGDAHSRYMSRHNNPGPGMQANWLPAPNGPFYCVFRVYLPGETVVNGTWKKPQLQPVPTK
jgi:hypothetical protein